MKQRNKGTVDVLQDSYEHTHSTLRIWYVWIQHILTQKETRHTRNTASIQQHPCISLNHISLVVTKCQDFWEKRLLDGQLFETSNKATPLESLSNNGTKPVKTVWRSCLLKTHFLRSNGWLGTFSQQIP